MEEKIKVDGGPMYPCTRISGNDPNRFIPFGREYKHEGITVRNWFAGMALQGSLANPTIATNIELYKRIPFRCFEMADAMIKEGEEK